MNGPDLEVIRHTVKETLMALGINACEPLEVQRDHAWLRRQRLSMEKLAGLRKAAVYTAYTTGFVAILIALAKWTIL